MNCHIFTILKYYLEIYQQTTYLLEDRKFEEIDKRNHFWVIILEFRLFEKLNLGIFYILSIKNEINYRKIAFAHRIPNTIF